MNLLFNFPDKTVPVENFSDRLIFGGFMLLVGMAVVFAVLIIIWGALALFKKFFASSNKRTPKEEPKQEAVIEAYTPCEAEIVSVIAAAIAAAESENDGLKFRVVSFKRK